MRTRLMVPAEVRDAMADAGVDAGRLAADLRREMERPSWRPPSSVWWTTKRTTQRKESV